MVLRIVFDSIEEQVDQAIARYEFVIGRAITGAFRQAEDVTKARARASILGARFDPTSQQWANALRSKVHPSEDKVSMRPALNLFMHTRSTRPYADIFEQGDTSPFVFGKPRLWLPMEKFLPRNLTKSAGKRPHLTIEEFRRKFTSDLVPMRGKSKRKTSLLGVKVRRSPNDMSRLTETEIRRGTQDFSLPSKGARRRTSTPIVTVPVFHMREEVKIPRKWRIREAIQSVLPTMERRYARFFRDD